MFAVIHPSNLSGAIHAPASKSSMQRACAAALLSRGRSIIHHPGHSDDDKAALDIVRRLGAEVIFQDEDLIITSSGVNPVTTDVNCGESGLSIRMFTPIIALADKPITIYGEGSLLNRPMDFFDEVLPQLGVEVESNKGRLPIRIKGPLLPKNIEIDGSLSSQFLTGLLMAYSSKTSPRTPLQRSGAFKDSDESNVSIKVRNLTSKPYIDLTLDVLKRFGLDVPENRNYENFVFSFDTHDSRPDSYRDTTHEYTVEGDWSGGAFLLVAGAIAGPITIRGLDMNSTQADKTVLEALSRANASFAIEAKGIKIRPSQMKPFEIDATDCPDLFPPLVTLASYCNGETKVVGVDRLTHKESNRAVSLQQEFGKMGVKIETHDDIMIIYGGGGLTGAKVHSHHDHRIAMACAVAALKAKGETLIEEADAVKKSYPDFFDDLIKIGADVSLSSKIKFHE
ncbi:MAG: 3-phosphoshikimate 1-carboxyvinyltransferase [Bacteroidetes bacterium]|nr:MAG: 3-phosphoshikimate 1-carboxyvinyltransferase [Bacteroidota bacterium]